MSLITYNFFYIQIPPLLKLIISRTMFVSKARNVKLIILKIRRLTKKYKIKTFCFSFEPFLSFIFQENKINITITHIKHDQDT